MLYAFDTCGENIGLRVMSSTSRKKRCCISTSKTNWWKVNEMLEHHIRLNSVRVLSQWRDAFEILISASELMLLTFKTISLVILPSIRNAMLALCLTFHSFYLLSLACCICNYLLKVHSAFDQKCIRTNNNNSIDAHLLSLSCAWQRTTFKFGQRASF